jgi:alpha-ribazole phosphatase
MMKSETKSIYLIRHFKPESKANILLGSTDVSLLGSSIDYHLDLLKPQLSTLRQIQNIHSSPLIRARSTAQAIFKSHKITLSRELTEIDFGEYELLSWPEIELNHNKFYQTYMKDWINTSFPKGESYQDLESRLSSFLSHNLDSNNQEDIAIVAHGGSIKALIYLLTELSIEEAFSQKVDYGEVIKLEQKSGTTIYSIKK